MKMCDNLVWGREQFGECDLGNRLRTERLEKVAAAMLACPEKSLPKQNSNWADLKAAYRLFDNPRVTFDAVAESHWGQTRHTKPGRYLLISDTTDLDYWSHPATAELGMLGDGKGRGIQLHSCLVYDSNADLFVGSAGALLHYRKHARKRETRTQRLARVRESEIWGNLVAQIGSPPAGSQWIHVFDRGGDNFEAMSHICLVGCDYIIRAAKLQRNVLDQQGEKLPLREAIQSKTFLGSYDLYLRSRQGVKARTAKLNVSVVRVTIPRPVHCSRWLKQCEISELEVNVVLVQEVRAPKGAAPIHWILFTSLSVESFDDAWQIIGDYEKRWLIEEYHKVLKSGCAIEQHALRKAERLEPLIGLISVIGTRLLQLKLIGRNQPQVKAKTHVPAEWLKALKRIKPRIQLTGMTVYQFFREIAKLGGFLGRTGDGEPGWQTVWLGYQRLQTLLEGMRLAGGV